MFTTFDRFLVRRFLHTFTVLFVTFYGLYCVIDAFTNADDFTDGDAGLSVILTRMASYYSWQSALVFDLTGPALLVFTVMISLALMVKAGELAPMLACGVPTYRLALPLLVGTGVVTGLIVANQELLLPAIASKLGAPRGGAVDGDNPTVQPVMDFSSNVIVSSGRLNLANRWIEEAEITLPVPGVVSELTVLMANRATYHPDAVLPGYDEPVAGWALTDVNARYEDLPLAPTPPGQVPIVLPINRRNPATGEAGATSELFIRTDIDFDQIHDEAQAAQVCGTPELVRRIRNPAYSGNVRHSFTVKLHERFRQPLLNLLATLVAVPLVIRREARSLVVSLAICVCVMGALMGLMQGGQLAGSVGLLPPDFAAWLPVIVAGTLATALSGKVLT
ncbi:LptF/LptG family permease [Alienimonas sp. DA493]|uniref:LptF/LptG family permease n=1 Tax=Alienimonas sp. DA493 TaxID=3373605 RepID=UPI0037542071